jgi:hypothetical protein
MITEAIKAAFLARRCPLCEYGHSSSALTMSPDLRLSWSRWCHRCGATTTVAFEPGAVSCEPMGLDDPDVVVPEDCTVWEVERVRRGGTAA